MAIFDFHYAEQFELSDMLDSIKELFGCSALWVWDTSVPLVAKQNPKKLITHHGVDVFSLLIKAQNRKKVLYIHVYKRL